jgi:hypothetical protein
LSKIIETPVNGTIFATGNNLSIAGDLTRRTIMGSLDAHCERPEQRKFEFDPIAVARANRPELVVAALTVLRAWHVAGETVRRSPLGSFEEWSHRIRAPLLWLDQADPCDTTLKVKKNDPQLLALGTVVAQWKEHIGVKVDKTIQEVINRAVNANDFHAALLNVAANRSSSVVSNDRFGRWLRKVEGRIVSGLMLKCTGTLNGYPSWVLLPM